MYIYIFLVPGLGNVSKLSGVADNYMNYQAEVINKCIHVPIQSMYN